MLRKTALQLAKGGPPRAPPARELAVAPTAGGCRPLNPPLSPLRCFCLIFLTFSGGARAEVFRATFGVHLVPI